MIKGRMIKNALICCAILGVLHSAAFADSFKNSITNIKFSKIDNNSIKINLVTSKPYSSQVCVLNKGNNK